MVLDDEDEGGVMTHLKRLDAWLDGTDQGEIPLEVLRARGMVIPDDDAVLDDATLTARLWEVIVAMADLGIVVEFTNHLSDRALYRYLVSEGLKGDVLLDGCGTWHLSPLQPGDDDYEDAYLRYYADDDDRKEWHRDFGTILPPKEKLPYDRDRFLPGGFEFDDHVS